MVARTGVKKIVRVKVGLLAECVTNYFDDLRRPYRA